MVSFKFLASAALATLVAANPIVITKRQFANETVTCGSNKYSVDDLESAAAEGCDLYSKGDQIGDNNYPHKFNNREGLPLETDGPYQEFPILPSGIYDGGKLIGIPPL